MMAEESEHHLIAIAYVSDYSKIKKVKNLNARLIEQLR